MTKKDKKYDKPVIINMDFHETMKRLSNVDKKDVQKIKNKTKTK